jgi:hypothetical protein
MKYLLTAVLAGLFLVNPAFAEEEKESGERRGRRERRERKGNTHEKREKRERSQWKILQNISAEERARLQQLHATNPEAFRKEIATIVTRIKQGKQELDKKVKSLVAKYKTSKDAETKKEAMEQLRKITQKAFLEKMQKNKKRLESLEKHVKKLRQQYEFRQKNADKIIKSRLNSLTNDSKFDW